MTKEQALQKLRSFATQGTEALRLLEQPRTEVLEFKIRELVGRLKGELEVEYLRTQPERAQRLMSMFEISIYSPTIEETWKESGIRRLKVESPIDAKWQDAMEAVAYMVSKYLH